MSVSRDIHSRVGGNCVFGTTQNGTEYILDMRYAPNEVSELFQCDLHLTPSGDPIEGICKVIEGGYSSIFDYKSVNPQSYYHVNHANYIPFGTCQQYGAHSVFYTQTDDGADTYSLTDINDHPCCGGEARVGVCPSWMASDKK